MFSFENTVIFALVFFCIAAAIFIGISRAEIVKKKTDYNMKLCRMIYDDNSNGIKDDSVETGRLLYSEKLDIQGKPDFVFMHSITGHIIPVEIKSGSIKDEYRPHDGDLMQLACYFAIAEEEFGRKVKYGKIIYKDYMFKVKNTKHLRKKLVNTVKHMRGMLEGNAEKAYPDYLKCRHCVCAGTVCEFCKVED